MYVQKIHVSPPAVAAFSRTRMKTIPLLTLLALGIPLAVGQTRTPVVRQNKRAFAVLDPQGPFRNGSQFFEPTPGVTPPYFQVYDDRFNAILGPNPTIRVIVENDTFAFAHDAPMWVPAKDQMFFSGGRTVGRPHPRLALLTSLTKVPLSDDVQVNNGGTLFRGDLLLATTGNGTLPPSLVRVNPSPPFNDTVILNNFYGRQFNSINDVKVHPQSRAIFFTDDTYGFENGFRPAPLIPPQVYRFDVDTGEVRVVADGLTQPNGIGFSPDGRTAADSGETEGVLGGVVPTLPATIYAFDLMPETQAFTNRRVFAFSDTGVPDGLALDTKGNLYVGCGDGTHVFDPNGTLLGKVFLGVGSASMAFAGANRLIIMADTRVYLAEIAAEGVNLDL
ncbi:D-lactonohydrolase-like protein [Mycena pura]|uniref:D-lactonohydrolase-like protein n=1 Tax=Mycena pura TaxID=153505 RepID=A0AAD7E611_9AGAR|nr:D-lactonohydrolase-like protein [Mycena pura]